MSERRHCVVTMTATCLDDLITGHSLRVQSRFKAVEAFPPDLHVIECLRRDWASDTWVFLCESNEFEIVPEGAEIPIYSPVRTVVNHDEERKSA